MNATRASAPPCKLGVLRSTSFPLAALCLCAGLLASVASAQDDTSPFGRSRPQDIVIKLVTFGPGDNIVNYFGHNALIAEDRALGISRLYNYGMFHFGPDMLPSYLKGRLTFWVGDGPVRETFAFYRDMRRSIRVQELNLSPESRLQLAQALARNVLPENRNYLYHHYYDNCSTRLRDMIDRAIDGQFKQALSQPARMSYRAHTRRYAAADPIIDFVLVFWMNDQMEQAIEQWHELFLPEELEAAVARTHYVNAQGKRVPLVDVAYAVYEAEREPIPQAPPTTWPATLLLGVLLGAAVIFTARALRRTASSFSRRLFAFEHMLVGLLFGVPGLLGFLMWTLTEHTVTYRNENQWLANPITFLLLPIGVAIALGSARAIVWARAAVYVLAAMSGVLLLLKLLPAFNQDTLLPMALLIPVNLGFALAHRVLAADKTAA